MTKISLLLVSALFMLFLNACNQEAEEKPLSLTSEYDSLSYCIGISFSDQIIQSLQNAPIDSLNIDMVAAAFVSNYNNADMLVDKQNSYAFLDNFFRNKAEQQKSQSKETFKDNLEAGQQFLLENSKNENVVTLPSGLQYEIVKKGNGKKPKTSDVISVYYHGTLIDGTTFDKSEEGNPLVIQLGQLIPGWVEALQLMPVGSVWKLYIPQDLAYQDMDKGVIKPYSALIFEIELLGIEKK